MERSTRHKEVIGWSEYIDFPDWAITSLQAKVDTGARTSALHVEDLEEIHPGWVSFYVVLTRKPPVRRKHVRAQVVKWAKVRSSTGVFRRRCFIKARVRIGHLIKEIELSLVSRERMLFRMLLGRKALEKDFLVDVTSRSVLGRPTRKKKKKIPE